ncbi:unnamed protein product [Callosobruchus maculatus]|uniref:Uncharacterized protein n=1 Tax=Callosobruchus maculatus TaxID=64391 RepID=A0A653D0N6_CALMS|nr:unnamed protein product [Callosobruchus maculatus]
MYILKDVSHSYDHQDDNHNNYLCHYHKHRLPQILAWAAEIRSIVSPPTCLPKYTVDSVLYTKCCIGSNYRVNHAQR